MADKVKWSMLTPDLKFRRAPDGKVVMRIGGEQTYITEGRWQEFVDSLAVPIITKPEKERQVLM